MILAAEAMVRAWRLAVWTAPKVTGRREAARGEAEARRRERRTALMMKRGGEDGEVWGSDKVRACERRGRRWASRSRATTREIAERGLAEPRV